MPVSVSIHDRSRQMMKIRTMISLAALALVASFGVQAQSGDASAQQKADVGAAKAAKPAPSTVDRKAAQKEAKEARKAGAANEGECGPTEKADAGGCKKPAADKSTKTRAEVKSEAAAATKAGKAAGGDKPQ
jgi:hypothetical protein